MTFKEKVEKLVSDIQRFKKNPDPGKMLPQNAFYLEKDEIVCGERMRGESRYPYDSDGLVVWARSSGAIEAYESTFNIFKTLPFSEDASVSFVAGFPRENGECFPISVLGGGRQLCEPIPFERSVVYTPECAYYIADGQFITFAVRMHVDAAKHIHFAFTAINKTDKEIRFYISSVMEAILRFREPEKFWDRMTKFGICRDHSFLLRSKADCLVINRAFSRGIPEKNYRTVGKMDVLGSGRLLSEAAAFKKGAFLGEHLAVNTTDIPAAAELSWFTLPPAESVRIDYELSYHHSIPEAQSRLDKTVDAGLIEEALKSNGLASRNHFDRMKIHFDGWTGKNNTDVLNRLKTKSALFGRILLHNGAKSGIIKV